MSYTYGHQPSDVVTNSRGDVVQRAYLEFFATQALAVEGITPLGNATSNSDGVWTYTDATHGVIWVRTQDGDIFNLVSPDLIASLAGGPGSGALLATNNLSDVVDKQVGRDNLGLGNSAVLPVGTGAGTVAAGDDSRLGAGVSFGTGAGVAAEGNDPRIMGALQASQNLADVDIPATARTNLGLGNSSTKNTGTAAGTVAAGDDSRFKAVGTTAGTVAAGDDSRITGAAQKSANLSDVNAATALINLGLTGANVTGARDTSDAIQSLLQVLDSYGIISDMTTATGQTGTSPAWYSSVVPTGEVAVAYSFTYVATGTPAPTYSVTAGTLPPGLTLASGGLLSGTPTTAGAYTFTVTATNGVAPDAARERTISIAGAPASVGAVYGPGIGYDTKSNIPITAGQKMCYRFKASASSALNAVRFTQRSGSGGYSAGTGGTMTVSVQADDGSGHPSGTSLASFSFNPVNYAGDVEVFDLKTFPSPATLTAGTTYYIVFTGNSDANYISINMVYCFNAVTPRQPKFADADFGMIYTSGAWGAINAGHTPVVDLVYANGTVQGQPYYEAMILHWRTISGTSQMVRERFTVTGGNRTATGAYARVRRGSGTSPLILSLDTVNSSTGAYISTVDSVSVAAASVPISSPGGDNGGSVWVGGNFAANRTLTNGSSYALRLSTASGTTYTTHPIREGISEVAYPYSSLGFRDGSGQYATTATNWTEMYAYGHQDMQCYFSLV